MVQDHDNISNKIIDWEVIIMIYPDIENAIKLIDVKIEELKNAKRTLLEAFGGKPVQKEKASSQSHIPQASKVLKEIEGTTRKDKLIKLLETEGPLSRSVILEKTGFPKGTISFLLNDKNTFFSENGRWHLIKEKKDPGSRTAESGS